MELRTSKMNIIQKVSRMTVIKLLSAVASFLIVAILARSFSVGEVGLYFFATALTYLLSQPPSGFGKAIKKRASEQNSGYISFLFMGVCFLIGYLIIISILTALWFNFVEISVGDIKISGILLFAVVLGTIGKSSSIIAREYLNGIGFPDVSQALLFVFYSLGQLVVVSLFVFVLEVSEVFIIFQTAQLTGIIVLISSFLVTFYVDGHQICLPSRPEIKRVFVFAKWSIITDIFNDLYHRVDTIFLAFFLSSVVVGYYESSVRIMSIAAGFPASINSVLSVKISGYHTEGENYTEFFEKYVKVIILFGILIVLFVLLFGEKILGAAFGVEYVAGYLIFLALMVQLLIQSIRGSFNSLFHGIDMPYLVTKVTTLTVLANISIAPLLILAFGGVGMVVATIITELCRVGYFYYSYHKYNPTVD